MKGEEIRQFLLKAISAALSIVGSYGLNAAYTYWLNKVLLDPNREVSKKAVKAKKDIAKRLGRPCIDTNSY